MTYPIPNYSRIWVRGKFVDLGKAAREEEFYGVGQPVIFTPSPQDKTLINQGLGQIISTGPFKVDTSKTDGYFAIALPATNDPDIIPFDFTYKVQEPTGRPPYDIKIPVDTPFLDSPGDPLHGQRVLDLVSVVPAPTPSAGTVQLLSGRGVWSVAINAANELTGMYTDGVTFNAGVVSVASVNGKTGQVVLAKADLGLGNVTNTSDTAKPVSTAQATAIGNAQSAAQTAAQGYVSTHESASDPHSQYYNTTRGDARYQKIVDATPLTAIQGLTGGRFVGIKTTSGAPTSGTFLVRDMLFNSNTLKWMICTVAGTPGTWVSQA